MKSNEFSWEEPWAPSREGPGSGSLYLGGSDGGMSCPWPPDKMWWCLELWCVGGCCRSPLSGGVLQGLDGSWCCPSGWTHQVFSTQGASGRLGQLRRAMPWLLHQPAYMATCSAVSPWALMWQHHSQALVGCLLTASAADGSLIAREEKMKGRGGTHHLLMLLGCISFQCRTEGSWWKRRQSSAGNVRELEGGVPGGSPGRLESLGAPQNPQRLEESERKTTAGGKILNKKPWGDQLRRDGRNWTVILLMQSW